MLQAAEVLQSKPRAEWTDVEQQTYLSNALWAVYSAVFSYELLNSELPDDLLQVVDQGLLASWPLNPYNDWRPMQVNAEGMGFSAGNLSLQLCPPTEYSYGAEAREVPSLDRIWSVPLHTVTQSLMKRTAHGPALLKVLSI
jgi:hypothetical protein